MINVLILADGSSAVDEIYTILSSSEFWNSFGSEFQAQPFVGPFLSSDLVLEPDSIRQYSALLLLAGFCLFQIVRCNGSLYTGILICETQKPHGSHVDGSNDPPDKCFSKKWRTHKTAYALYFTHHNFCRVHSSPRVTPAMEARITNHVWSLNESVAA